MTQIWMQVATKQDMVSPETKLRGPAEYCFGCDCSSAKLLYQHLAQRRAFEAVLVTGQEPRTVGWPSEGVRSLQRTLVAVERVCQVGELRSQ